MPDPTRPDIGAIHTVGIPVTDQERARHFYVEILGFDLVMDMPLPQLGSRWIVVRPQGSTAQVALVAGREGAPAGVETGIRFRTGDADGTRAVLAARGVAVGEVLRWPGVPAMFEARDPDRNRFEITE